MLIIIRLDAQESPAPLVVRRHGNFRKEGFYYLVFNPKILEDMHRTLFHDILGAWAGGHTGHFCPNTLTHNRCTKRPAGNRACMNFYNFVAGRMTDRGFPLNHEFTAHQDFGPVGIFMTVEEFSRYGAAEIFNLFNLTIDCLLEHFIDHFKIAREVCPLETPGQVDKYIKR